MLRQEERSDAVSNGVGDGNAEDIVVFLMFTFDSL